MIGRAFLYEILSRITELKEQIDKSLMGLERLDLIRTRSLQPDLEYIFKHALTQEVVYNGFSRRSGRTSMRRSVRSWRNSFRTGSRNSTRPWPIILSRGNPLTKAVEYLMKAGEKSFTRYALDESHQFYKEAFDLLSQQTARNKEEETLLIDLLNEWAFTLSFNEELSASW